MSSSQYKFSSELKKERRLGTDSCCEMCGKFVSNGEVHHLVGAYLGSQNPILAPHIIRSLENEAYLCKSCHADANEAQHRWEPIDIGFMAWALFDLDPLEVADAQVGTYKTNGISFGREKKKKIIDQKRQARKRSKRRKNKMAMRRRRSGRAKKARY